MSTEIPEDLKMMHEWAESLLSRLPTMDLRHTRIDLDWFISFAKSAIERQEQSRSIAEIPKIISRIGAPEVQRQSPDKQTEEAGTSRP